MALIDLRVTMSIDATINWKKTTKNSLSATRRMLFRAGLRRNARKSRCYAVKRVRKLRPITLGDNFPVNCRKPCMMESLKNAEIPRRDMGSFEETHKTA